MLLLRESLKNTEDMFRVTNSLKENLRDDRLYRNSYPTHIHDSFIEFEIVRKGYMIQKINGTEYNLPEGSIAILKPNDYHSIETSKDSEIYNIHFLPSVISRGLLYSILNYEKNIVCTFSGNDAKNIINSSVQLFEEYESRQSFRNNIIRNLIENICYVTLRRLDPAPSREKDLTPMQKATLYLRINFMNSPSLNDVAEHVHLNPTYFSRVFKKHTGTPYSRFLIGLKLNYAKKLLCETDMTITDICFYSGFGSLSNFSRYFKIKFGITPQQMRRKYGLIKTEFYNETNTKALF